MLEEIYNMLKNIEEGSRFEIIKLSFEFILVDLFTFNLYKLPNGIKYAEHPTVNSDLCREDIVEILVFLNDILTLIPNFGNMENVLCDNSVIYDENKIKKSIKNLQNADIKDLYFKDLLYKFMNKKPTFHSECKTKLCKWRFFCNFNTKNIECNEIQQYLINIISCLIEYYFKEPNFSQIKQGGMIMSKKIEFLSDDNLFGFTEISDSEYLSTLGTNCCGVVQINNTIELKSQECYDGGKYSVPSPSVVKN